MESTSEKVKEEESPPSDAQPTDRPNLSGECLDLLRKKMISDLSLKVFRNDLESKITKMEPLQISKERQSVIDNILEQISKLSDPEKLLLFLKLPSPTTERIDPLKQPLNPLGNRQEIQQTIVWIKTHLEEDRDISIPKQDVYEQYLKYCANVSMKPLSTADFGKVMKQVYPGVRPRRLGTRGNSRYCYSGMRSTFKLPVPSLPDLVQPNSGTEDTESGASSTAQDNGKIQQIEKSKRKWTTDKKSKIAPSPQNIQLNLKEIKCAKRPKVDDVKKEDLCQPETSENTDDKLKCEEISGNAVNALDGCNLGNDLAICFENMDNVTYTIPEEFTEGINLDLFNKIDFQNTELDLQTSGIIKIQPNVPAGMEQEPPVKNVSPIIQNKLILDQSGGKKISILNGTENYLVQKNDVKVQKVKVRKSNSFSKPVRGFKKFYVPIQPKPVQPSDSNLKVHFGLDQSAILTRGVMKKNSRGSFCEYSQDLEGETITYFQNLDEPRLLPASILPENIGVVDNVIRINDYPRVVKLEDNAATKTLESIFQTSQNCLETPKVISQVENLSGITSLSSFEILGQQQQPPQPIQEIRNSGNSDKDKVSHLRLLLEKSIVPEIQNNGKNGGFIFEKPQPSDRQTMRCIVMAGNAGNVAANTVGFNIVADRKMPKLLMQRSKSAADKRVPQSSNTPKYLNFTPISPRPKSPLKAPIIPITSTFVSPRTTPVSRSRQNSISHEPFLLPKIPIDNDFKTERAGKGKLSNSQKSSLGENVPDYQKAPGLGRPRSNSSNFSRVRKNRSKVLSSGRDSIKPQPVQNGAVNIYSFPLPPPGQGVYLDPVSNEVRNLIANPTIIQSANSRSQSVPLNYVIGDGSWFSQQVTPIYGQYLNPENPELNGSEIKEFSGLKTEPKNLEPLIPDEQIPLSLDQMDEVFTGDSQDINSLVQKIGNELFGSNFENNTSNNNNNSNNADTTNKDNFIQNNAFVQENIFSDKIDLNSDGTFSEVFPGEPDSLICEDMKPYLQTFEGNDDEGSKEKIKLFGNMFDSGNDNANDPLINSFKPTFMGEITTCPNSPVLGLFGSKYNEDSQLIEFLGLNG